jgi:tetratricopeptide (TPR) repeat protein
MARLNKNSQGQAISTPTWLYGPWLDLIVGCGAWSAPLLLISYFSIATNTNVWSIAFYGLALVFNYPHYMATIYRAYHRLDDFQKYRIFTVYTTALLFLTALLSHVWMGILPWIFTLYLTWSPWHYSGQNYGLFMMFARRSGANLTKLERQALYGAFITSYLVLFIDFHTGPSSDPLFLSLGIPSLLSRWLQIGFGVIFILLSVFGWSRLLRAVGWRSLLPCATLFSTQFLWSLLPAAMSVLKGIPTPQSRYSAGILAVMHSAQYLWITSYYARREASEKPGGAWRPWAYVAVLTAGGIALFVPGPWLASRFFHRDFTASFLIFTALVNLHHFILDGAIWKLRDGRIAALLLNSRDRVSNAASEVNGSLSRAWGWLTGSTASARWVRVSAALLLLLWGTVDQARHYLSLRTDLHDLQRAAYLDSVDSQLQMRLAHQELVDGHPKDAELAWKNAIQSSPENPAPRQALLRFLIEQKRFDEAFELTQSSLHYSSTDPNLLVDSGLLALRFGHADQALDNWNRALEADPNQFLAHLYLANELDHEGKTAEAAAHYQAYLAYVGREPAEKRPPAQNVIVIALRMADCQSRAKQTARAHLSYQMAEMLAAQTKQAKLESVASVNDAELQAAAGKLDDALQLYQRTLQLDDSIGDATAAAVDWISYGRLLDRSGFPAQLVYACFVKSATFDKSNLDASQREFLAAASRKAAAQVGRSAAEIRQDPEPMLHEALILRR